MSFEIKTKRQTKKETDNQTETDTETMGQKQKEKRDRDRYTHAATPTEKVRKKGWYLVVPAFSKYNKYLRQSTIQF